MLVQDESDTNRARFFDVGDENAMRGYMGYDAVLAITQGASLHVGAEAGYDSTDAFTLQANGGLTLRGSIALPGGGNGLVVGNGIATVPVGDGGGNGATAATATSCSSANGAASPWSASVTRSGVTSR